MNHKNPILAVGSIAFDDLKTSTGNEKNVLGGSATYFSIAASLLSSVKIVGVVGDDFPKSAWDLFKEKKIDFNNGQVKKGDTFHWGGQYSEDFSIRETLFTNLGVFENFNPSIKKDDLNVRFLFLGNIQPDLQLQVINDMHSQELIFTDTMNLWIETAKQKVESVFSHTDVLLLNHEEAYQYTNEKKLELAAEKLHDSGPNVVIIKLGSEGAYLSEKTSTYFIPVFPINKVVDPTGAGDSFAGGLIGHLSNMKKLDFLEAVITASAMASFAVEGFGIFSIANATKSALDHRINVIKNKMNINQT